MFVLDTFARRIRSSHTVFSIALSEDLVSTATLEQKRAGEQSIVHGVGVIRVGRPVSRRRVPRVGLSFDLEAAVRGATVARSATSATR